MRRIALLCSLIITIVGCSDNLPDDYISGYVSVSYLRSCLRQSTTLITDDIYLSGVIIANDKYGELTKTVVVSDDSGGVAIDLDIEDIEARYPLFSSVRVRCSGLWLGSVGAKLVLGAEPTGEYIVDRIAEDRVYNHLFVTTINGTPAPRRKSISELEYSDVMSMVIVDNLTPIAEEHGLRWTDIDLQSGRAVTAVRHLTDGQDTLRVVTTKDCQYAKESIPTLPMRLYGVLDWYGGDMALRVINHGIVIY